MAIIPAGLPDSMETSVAEDLLFVAFGTPPMSMADGRASPRKEGRLLETLHDGRRDKR